jgi:hypothetical protein
LFKTRFTDLCYGYNAFWRDVLPVLDLPANNQPGVSSQDMLWGDGFEIETLLNCRVAATKMHVAEVPSVEKLRIHGVSNLNAMTDGTRVLRTMLVERRRARQHEKAFYHNRAISMTAHFDLENDMLGEAG